MVTERSDLPVVSFPVRKIEEFFPRHDVNRVVAMLPYIGLDIEYVDENENVIIQYVVPKQLRVVMITKAHDGVYRAHQGRDKVIERLRRSCYWPKMNQEIAEYIKTCEICQSIKPPNQ